MRQKKKSRLPGTYSGVFTLLPLLSGNGREHHGEIMREASALAGKLNIRLDPTAYTLEARSVTAAHAAVAQGTARGKVVVHVADE